MLSTLFSCNRFDRDAETAVVKKVVHNSIGWALNKDLDLLYSLVLQDSTFFIFHPDSGSTIVGFDAFQNLSDFWMDSAFQAIHFEVRELRIHFSDRGETAWYSCFLDDFAEWNGNPIGWANTRWTGVLEKRNKEKAKKWVEALEK